MAYTPPAGNAILIDLASGVGSYTPPAGDSILIDLATQGGVSGQVEFIDVYGSLQVLAYAPKNVVVQPVGYGTISVTAYVPTFLTTKQSDISVAGGVSVTFPAPSFSSSKTSVIGAAGAIAVSFPEPAYFKGNTQQIAESGAITVTGYGVTHTKLSHVEIPSSGITITAPLPTHVIAHTLGDAAHISVVAQAGISHKQLIRNAIDAKYFTPDVTLDAPGVISITAYAPTATMRIRSSVELNYGLMQRAIFSFVGRYTARVAAEIASTYKVYGTVSAEATGKYNLSPYDKVQGQIVSAYRMPISSSVDSTYSVVENVRVASSIESPYSMIANTRVRQSVDCLYTMVQLTKIRNGIAAGYTLVQALRALGAVEAKYSYTALLSKAVVSKYHMTTPVRAEGQSYYDIESVRKVRSLVSAIYSMPISQVIAITTAPYLEYEGKQFGVVEAEVSVSEGDYAWKAAVVLTDVADYAKIKQDKPFALVIGAERYEFIVDSKELDRSNPANYAAKLLGISPSAVYESPRHDAMTYLWDTFVQASDVAGEVLPGIDWRVIDWGIPAYRLAAQDVSPIGIVKLLAEAIGAVLESDIDGSLYVRSKYPVSVPNYYTATPAHIFIEDTDILSVSESYVSLDVFNRLVITDVSNDISDSLEWLPDYAEATTGVMRAYLYPWRSGVSLLHTGLPGVTIDAPTLGMEQHTEIIEVFQGQGQTAYPIHHVDTVDYEAANVGSLVFDVDSRSFTVSGPSFNSVIRIVYWTRSLDYRVSLPQTRPTQFLLESAPL